MAYRFLLVVAPKRRYFVKLGVNSIMKSSVSLAKLINICSTAKLEVFCENSERFPQFDFSLDTQIYLCRLSSQFFVPFVPL